MERHVEPGRPAAAIDNRRGADDLRSRRGRNLHRLPRGAAGREHVLDDEHAIALGEREPAPQRQCAVLPLGENGAHAERAAHFMADDDAPERGCEHHRGPQIARPLADELSERLRMLRVLQHERALQSTRTVQPGGEPEASLQQGAGTAKQIEELRGGVSSQKQKVKQKEKLRQGETNCILSLLAFAFDFCQRFTLTFQLHSPAVPKLSVTVITKNEAADIAEALESAAWADEIVVVDSASADDTVAIARRFTDRVIVREWPGYGAQKNYAAAAASHDWILSLDADERITPALADGSSDACRAPAPAGYRAAAELASGPLDSHHRLVSRLPAAGSTIAAPGNGPAGTCTSRCL